MSVVTENLTYDTLVLSETSHVEAVTIALTATPIVRGMVLGRITSGGKFLPSVRGTATDGSEVAAAIAATDVNASAGDVVAAVFVSGVLNADLLTYPGTHTAATVQADLLSQSSPLFVETPRAAYRATRPGGCWSNAMSLFDNNMLGRMIEALDPTPTFFLDRFFTTELPPFDTQTILVDELNRRAKRSFFINRSTPSPAEGLRGGSSRQYTPPYIKHVAPVDPNTALARRVGENPRQPLSAAARLDAVIMQQMQDHQDMIKRAEEWMASSALFAGSIAITGKYVTADTISFGRDAGLTIVLSGGSRWGQSGVSPIANLKAWMNTLALTGGAGATDVVFGAGAWDFLTADTGLEAWLHWSRSGAQELNLGLVDSTKGQFMGFLGSGVRAWLYTGQYEDETGTMQYYLPTNGVLMASEAVEGFRTYAAVPIPPGNGAPMGGLDPVMYRHDIGGSFDPPQASVMTQSAPLPIVGRANATLAATVA